MYEEATIKPLRNHVSLKMHSVDCKINATLVGSTIVVQKIGMPTINKITLNNPNFVSIIAFS